MMVDGAEEGQLSGPIDILVPYTYEPELRKAGVFDKEEAMSLAEQATTGSPRRPGVLQGRLDPAAVDAAYASDPWDSEALGVRALRAAARSISSASASPGYERQSSPGAAGASGRRHPRRSHHGSHLPPFCFGVASSSLQRRFKVGTPPGRARTCPHNSR